MQGCVVVTYFMLNTVHCNNNNNNNNNKLAQPDSAKKNFSLK